ncbi:hypothetical protein POTOM_055722 [Populus tomentosa]|uniref:Uncharacterized protein n=1 Tax=Populus tomentosa TaxID=118781 RepID=A0A8X7XXU1_POPTO|nr:hypothetical protein POTOM_055722 [Populus tomentosa]
MMTSSRMDSNRDLINLVRLLLSVKTMVMVNGDELQLGLERYTERVVRSEVENVLNVFIAREQICLKRLGISNTQCCRTPSYKSEVKRKRSGVRLVELPKLESIKGEKKGLCLYFLSTEIPVYTLLLALGVRSDSRDASIVTIFVMLMRNVSIF